MQQWNLQKLRGQLVLRELAADVDLLSQVRWCLGTVKSI